jgi:hypothetical protein
VIDLRRVVYLALGEVVREGSAGQASAAAVLARGAASAALTRRVAAPIERESLRACTAMHQEARDVRNQAATRNARAVRAVAT